MSLEEAKMTSLADKLFAPPKKAVEKTPETVKADSKGRVTKTTKKR